MLNILELNIKKKQMQIYITPDFFFIENETNSFHDKKKPNQFPLS